MRLVMAFAAICASSVVWAADGTKAPPLPDAEGVAGAFAGVSHGCLLVAGGANFPDKKPWEGGRKAWYDAVYVLSRMDGEWRRAGRLPRPLGYGVSVTHGQGVICVGGSDAERHYADAFRLEWKDERLVTTGLPALPSPLANTCGAMVGETLYVAGGQRGPTSETSRATYRLNLAAAKLAWEEIAACPGGGRMLAVAAGFDGAFWIISGVDLVAGPNGAATRKYLRDAYRHRPDQGWRRIADVPQAVAAAPSPAPTGAGDLFLLGGDDGSQVGIAADKHRGFSRTVLRYDARYDRWKRAGELAAPRVTAPCVAWGDRWIIASGEVCPGVRSPEMIPFTPPRKD